MRHLSVLTAFFAAFLTGATLGANGAQAKVVAEVDLPSQTMKVYVNGSLKHRWKISSARKGYVTPTGTYRPKRLHTMWYSKKYYNSPMPYSVFFRGGYAIHGTGAVSKLGRPASHGCIRLRTSNARKLFRLIKRYGMRKTSIRISNGWW